MSGTERNVTDRHSPTHQTDDRTAGNYEPPEGFKCKAYETTDENGTDANEKHCCPCPDGAICEEGTTLHSLEIMENYCKWGTPPSLTDYASLLTRLASLNPQTASRRTPPKCTWGGGGGGVGGGRDHRQLRPDIFTQLRRRQFSPSDRSRVP